MNTNSLSNIRKHWTPAYFHTISSVFKKFAWGPTHRPFIYGLTPFTGNARSLRFFCHYFIFTLSKSPPTEFCPLLEPFYACDTHLELVFVAAQRRALFLPEVVWLYYIGNVDGAGKMFLQYLQDRLHGAPSGAPHVDDHCEPLLPYFITASRKPTAVKT